MDNFDFDDSVELNITPLVDIMLVLLAILMVTIPTVNYKEDIVLPKGSKTSKINQESILEVRINKESKIFIRDKVYEYDAFPDNFMLFSKSYNKDTPVHLVADKNIKYENVIFVLKAIKEAGFLRVSLVTSG